MFDSHGPPASNARHKVYRPRCWCVLRTDDRELFIRRRGSRAGERL